MLEASKKRSDHKEFFFHVGFVISRWAHIDRTLFDCCRFALNTNPHKASVVFYRAQTIGEHLGLTDSLMTLSLSAKNAKLWRKLSKRINDLLPFRNEIAHNPAGVFGTSTITVPKDGSRPAQINFENRWWAIETEESKLLNKNKKPAHVKIEDLDDHARAVIGLEMDLYNFVKKLPKRALNRPAKSSRPKPAPKSG
jgi:hypothetical protein